MNSDLLLNESIKLHTPNSYYEFVHSLFIKPTSKTQTGVDGVRVLWGKRLIVTVSRKPKYVTYSELETLAKEGAIAIDELYRQFRKRKIELRN